MDGALKLIASIFLALFAGIWLWIAWKVWDFEPTADVPTLVFSDAVASTAGLLSSAVAAATAGVLGIEVQKAARAAGGSSTLIAAVRGSRFLKVGVVTYLVVGVVNLLVWLGNSEIAPELVAAFALGAVGWMAGAFSAVFQSSNSGGGSGGGGRTD